MDNSPVIQEQFEETVRTFNKVAPVYYKRMGDYFRDPRFTDYMMIDKLFSFLSARSQVLDIGCGPGGAAERFVQKGHIVKGIDIADAMIAQARIDVPQASFIKMDMRELDFENNSFDCVLSLYSLYQLLDEDSIIQTLSEMYRVLKPGGILVIALKDMKDGVREVTKHWIDPETNEKLGIAYYNFIERGYILPKLHILGFKNEYESFWSESRLDKNSAHRFYILRKHIK